MKILSIVLAVVALVLASCDLVGCSLRKIEYQLDRLNSILSGQIDISISKKRKTIVEMLKEERSGGKTNQ